MPICQGCNGIGVDLYFDERCSYCGGSGEIEDPDPDIYYEGEGEYNEMNKQRIIELIRALDNLTQNVEIPDDADINEIMGIYDGRIMAIRDMWNELKNLMGITGGIRTDD